ncbi:MAG: DUF4382 domain-containing protein [Balneolales bacterium]
MIQSKLTKTIYTISTAALLFITGCDGISTNSDTGMGSMEIRLHDAPADYDEVNVFVKRVEINNADEEGGWKVINEPNQKYNLLELTNGAYEVLGNAELETGTYPQIRLILSKDQNSLVVAGEEKDLFIPSGAQTGIKLNINAEINEGTEYVLLLDFDADRSVVVTGPPTDPGYILKPVIRASNEAVTGNIGGAISPVDARPAVFAISGEDTLSTTYADTLTGEFRLVSLEEGNYTVSVNAREDGYETETIEDVPVTIGETNELNDIELTVSSQ